MQDTVVLRHETTLKITCVDTRIANSSNFFRTHASAPVQVSVHELVQIEKHYVVQIVQVFVHELALVVLHMVQHKSPLDLLYHLQSVHLVPDYLVHILVGLLETVRYVLQPLIAVQVNRIGFGFAVAVVHLGHEVGQRLVAVFAVRFARGTESLVVGFALQTARPVDVTFPILGFHFRFRRGVVALVPFVIRSDDRLVLVMS